VGFVKKVAQSDFTWSALLGLGVKFLPSPLLATELGLAVILAAIGGVAFIISYNLALLIAPDLKKVAVVPFTAGLFPAMYGAMWPATVMPTSTTVLGGIFGAILVGMITGGIWFFLALLIEHRRSQARTSDS